MFKIMQGDFEIKYMAMKVTCSIGLLFILEYGKQA